MKSIVRLAAVWSVLAALCAGLLSGCAEYVEYQKALQQMERLASTMALDYVSETFGEQAQVLDVKVGTYQAGFSSYVDTDALVTVALDGSQFQVYVETKEPQLCADNRGGLALAEALDEYFQTLYGLPAALEHSVQVYFGGDFFAARSTHLAHEYNFLPFDYHGQPVEEILPLLDEISLLYDYADDSVSLERIDLRAEDWGGQVERLRVQIYSFRVYHAGDPVPMGIEIVDGLPVLMAEGMQFSRKSGGGYGSLADIREQVPYFSLREALLLRNGEVSRLRWEAVPMGDFWVCTREGLSAADCFELRDVSADWNGARDRLGTGTWSGLYYTREEIEGDELPASIKKDIFPFLDAQFSQTGQMLCLKEGALERIRGWEGPVPYNACSVPLCVMVRPSLVYGAEGQMGAGLLRSPDGTAEIVVQPFSQYLNEDERWFNALNILNFLYPQPLDGIALVRQDLR